MEPRSIRLPDRETQTRRGIYTQSRGTVEAPPALAQYSRLNNAVAQLQLDEEGPRVASTSIVRSRMSNKSAVTTEYLVMVTRCFSLTDCISLCHDSHARIFLINYCAGALACRKF